MKSFLLKEEEIEANNRKILDEKIPYKWEVFWGNRGQQNFVRTSRYEGFKFLNPEEIDPKVWKEAEKGMFFPNRRTKVGREMASFLANGMKATRYNDPLEILGCNHFLLRFKFPFIQQCDDTIILFLDDQLTPQPEEDIIEITRKEFMEIHNQYHNE